METPGVSRIGDYIKEQRESARVSLRRLAEDAGVSNPYLSQIERGLRKPSAEILQQLAKALRISAEQLYVQAGLLEDTGQSLAVPSAIVSDSVLNERQKRVLLDIYDSFLAEKTAHQQGESTSSSKPAKNSAVKKSAVKKPTAKRSVAKKSQTKRAKSASHA